MGCGTGHRMDLAVADRDSPMMRSGVEGRGKAIHPEIADGGLARQTGSVYKRILRPARPGRQTPTQQATPPASNLQAVG